MNVSKWYIIENKIAISFDLKMIQTNDVDSFTVYNLLKQFRRYNEESRKYYPPISHCTHSETGNYILHLGKEWTLI